MRFFMLAGTKDGRELAKAIQDDGHEILLSTLTKYGASLAEEYVLKTRYGALDESQLTDILQTERFDAVIDATHPYAQAIQSLAKTVCAQLNLPYYRWQRPQTPLRGKNGVQDRGILEKGAGKKDNTRVLWADDIAHGAELAAQLGNRILLTTGSHTLGQWMACPSLKTKEVFIRVLPTQTVIKQCEQLGFKPYQIIGAQGPFSREFNEVILKDLQIDVLVAKDSGIQGGTPEKVEACQNLKIPIILLKRPGEPQISQANVYGVNPVEEEGKAFSRFIKECLNLSNDE